MQTPRISEQTSAVIGDSSIIQTVYKSKQTQSTVDHLGIIVSESKTNYYQNLLHLLHKCRLTISVRAGKFSI